MRYLLLYFLFVMLASAQGMVCPTGQVYAKITKKTTIYGDEESFKILSGTTELYTSPSLVDNYKRTIEICLAATTNNIYTLKMNDSGGDSWSDGAWISIEGINGNLVFKQMMTAGLEEEYQFSLYSPINKGSTWKYTANASGTWTMANFADQGWTDVVTGNTAQTATGTQYFRHTFTGTANFAAVEFQLLYRYGAIAYINGVEVYRDNMPVGPVTAATTAEGSYPTVSYHGAIRSADVAEAASNVLAVELHFLVASYSETIQFNGFLSLLAGIAADNKCFVLPQDPSITNSGFTSPEYAFNWSRNSYAYTSTTGSYLTADYNAITSRGEINGFRVWPYSSPITTIGTFTVSGAQMIYGPFEEVFAVTDATYASSQWKQWIRVTPSQRYNYLRLTITTTTTSVGFYEFQFMVCNTPPPTTIAYTQTKTSFYRNYEAVDIRPDNYGFSNCQINPTLPAGLVWNSATCSVSGIPTEDTTQQTYTVTTTVGTVSATGTISLAVTDCASSLYKIVRTYKSSPQNEYFRIYDTATSTTIYEVTQGHTHAANAEWIHFLCISQERFDVVFYHTGNYWMSNSYFYMYYVLPNDEQEMVVKGRFDNLEQVVSNQYLRRPTVGHSEQWKYKFDSVPANWYTADVFNSWSQGTRGSFGTATNKIQLFAKTFNVNNLNEVKGYILSIRYKYGCVVYLNGHEAFRNGVTGDITSSPTATNVYTDVKYHVVTLPGKTIPTTAQPTTVTYLQQGTNTIAIALVALADSQTTVDFDCIVRLMAADQSESHMWEMTGSMSSMSGNALYPFNQYYGNTIYYGSTSACTTNYLQVTLDNDRREWTSSMHIQNYYTTDSTYGYPTQFKVYGRNPEDSDWTLLKEVTGLTWSMAAQKSRIYFQNNKSYNQFRFENIFAADHASRCYWRVQSFDMYADNTMAELAPLTYPSSVEIFKDIEMSEIIPTGDGYYDFTVNPPLPAGVNLDPHTGWISGTASVIAATQTYTITANKITGGTATATISITVAICTGGRSLMTVRFRADAYSSENSWKLYQGRGTTGTVLQQVTSFPVANTYYYVDFCLNDGLYTLEGQDTYGDGWSANTGYTLTADVGAMELEIMEMYSGTKPVKVSSVFSTYFPFQFEYSDWKINQSGFVEGWTGITFDDSTWLTKKANEIPTTEQMTTYIRKTFTITNIADYQVLNVRIKYFGGVACYFNGNMVALINMKEGFDENTESIEVHDPSIDGKFHIILPTAGMVEGTNVIAFEIHRPKGVPSTEPVVFDATGVFGVDDCSVVLDSYSEVTSTAVTAGTLAGILDLDPYTTGTLPNNIGTYVQWTVDNRLGSKWNKFNIHQAGSVTSWGFMIYGNSNPDEQGSENISIFQGTELAVNGRTRPNLDVPVALAGFRRYRWEVIDTASSAYATNAMFQVYCKATGAVCPGIENYPAVGEGQISPASCPEGYRGYSYRECAGGQLGEIKMDKCGLKPPMNARYSRNRYQFVKNTQVSTGVPTVRGIVSKWFLDTGVFLPEGLTLNEQTGEISGTPKDTMDMTSYTVYAENVSGITSAVVTISVRVGQCMAEGVFPVTEVGKVALYDCSLQGSYVGIQRRACVLGAEDGEWQEVTGSCISSFTECPTIPVFTTPSPDFICPKTSILPQGHLNEVITTPCPNSLIGAISFSCTFTDDPIYGVWALVDGDSCRAPTPERRRVFFDYSIQLPIHQSSSHHIVARVLRQAYESLFKSLSYLNVLVWREYSTKRSLQDSDEESGVFGVRVEVNEENKEDTLSQLKNMEAIVREMNLIDPTVIQENTTVMLVGDIQVITSPVSGEDLDFTCDKDGYNHYLNEWSTAMKTTSRDEQSEEYKQRLGYFIQSCQTIHDWNKKGKYQMSFTYYADWSQNEFEQITLSTQRYTGSKVFITEIEHSFNNTNWRHLMPTIDPCDDVFEDGSENTLRTYISKPQECSVSWAFAVTNSIEYAIEQLYEKKYGQAVKVALSAQELIDCVAIANGLEKGNCEAMPLTWAFDYIYDNGIAYRQFYHHTNKAEECKQVNDENKYFISGYEKPTVYNKYGLFEMLERGPVAVALGLNTKRFQYYGGHDQDVVMTGDQYFSNAFWRPSVYGVVLEYKQYVGEGKSEFVDNPYFTVESRLRACDSFLYRLPITDNEENANFAGIAGYAIRPRVKELVNVHIK